jgi:cupin 2 domain-containing protein
LNRSDAHGYSGLLEIPEDWDGNQERFDLILQTPSLRIERILSRGHTTPAGEWYDQDHDEWVTILAGAARLVFDNGEEKALGTGDAILLPAHTRHRVVFTTAEPVCIWLAIHGPSAGGTTL